MLIKAIYMQTNFHSMIEKSQPTIFQITQLLNNKKLVTILVVRNIKTMMMIKISKFLNNFYSVFWLNQVFLKKELIKMSPKINQISITLFNWQDSSVVNNLSKKGVISKKLSLSLLK